jgi:hypothetical protein
METSAVAAKRKNLPAKSWAAGALRLRPFPSVGKAIEQRGPQILHAGQSPAPAQRYSGKTAPKEVKHHCAMKELPLVNDYGDGFCS